MKIITITGDCPQIIKAAALSREIAKNFNNKISEIIVHIEQHYDENMSDVFFKELNIPEPHIMLNVGSKNHAAQTAQMMSDIENVLIDNTPDALVIYGDTNSTLAGALASAKLNIPIVHIESGLRSFNKKMSEEINRVIADHCSTLLFCPTKTAIKNLENEGFSVGLMHPYTSDKPGVFHCGDIMFDNSVFFAKIAEQNSDIINKNALNEKDFILATIHRNENTDDKNRLDFLFSALCQTSINTKLPIIFPAHPRTLKKILEWKIGDKIHKSADIRIIPPASFLDMILLEKNCKLVMTDSGGVQKEAFFFNHPSIILRNETEWVEIVELRAAQIADKTAEGIAAQAEAFINYPPSEYPPVFGDGNAANFICNELLNFQKTISKK